MRYQIPFLLLAGALVAGCQANRAELASAVAARDSLLTEVLSTTKFVAELNNELDKARVAELATPTGSDRGVPDQRAERARTLDKVQKLIARLNDSETRLEQTRTRAEGLQQKDAKLVAQIKDFQQQLADMRTSAQAREAELQATIDDLTAERDELQTQNTRLSLDKADLLDTVTALTDYKNTVYYAIGTKDDLIKRGILVQEGWKFLIFGGKSLQPARDLDPAQFRKLDKSEDKVLTFPPGAGPYKIVSRQDIGALSPESLTDGKAAEGLVITDPEKFWGPSKFLILVQS